MYQDLRRSYWWGGLKPDVARFVAQCATCQQVKIEHSRPGGEIHPLPVPQRKWEDVTMDFVTGLRSSRSFDVIWVIVDRLTKTARFIPIRETWPVSRLVEEYTRQIVRLHGVCWIFMLVFFFRGNDSVEK